MSYDPSTTKTGRGSLRGTLWLFNDSTIEEMAKEASALWQDAEAPEGARADAGRLLEELAEELTKRSSPYEIAGTGIVVVPTKKS